jgi:hypothetical protein
LETHWQNRVNVQTTKPLEVKDRKFAVEFGRCLAKVLEGTPESLDIEMT